MTSIFLNLSIPPSINSYYQYQGHRRYVGAKGIAFKKEVALAVVQQPIRFGKDRLKLSVIFNFADKRKQDISNRIKALEDALVQAGLFDDDSQIDEIQIQRGQIIKGGKTVLKISVVDWELRNI